MEIKSYEDDELEELYQLWRKVAKERELASEKDKKQFKDDRLETEERGIQCFTAYEENSLVGASILMLRKEKMNAYLDFLVLEEKLRSKMSSKLLTRSLKFVEEREKLGVELHPDIYSPRFIEILKEHGFEEKEDSPYQLWMKKDLSEIPEYEKPKGVEIIAVRELEESGLIEGVAKVGLDYLDADLHALMKKFKKEDRDYDNILYGIAQKDGEVLGFSRTVFQDSVGKKMRAINEGLTVKKGYTGQGIGGALLVDSFWRIREKGCDEMYISTTSRNPARRLYKRLGFEVKRKQPNLFYGIV